MSGYIMDLRKEVGHRPLMMVGASVILADDHGRLLLQRRRDNGLWGYHGGSVELNERVEDAARRELFEETGLTAGEMTLFGVFSGPDMHYVYPNGDEVSIIDCVFLCRDWTGTITPQADEVTELRFFAPDALPDEAELSPPNRPAFRKWRTEERFDVVNAQGQPIGRTVTRTEAHALGIRHRTAHIWVARREGERLQVLLQKRSQGKDSNPGCWDTSSAGHIDAGEAPLPSALRELHEELGIEAGEEDLCFLGTFPHRGEDVFYGKPFWDDEVSFVYVYDAPVDIKDLRLQEEEVEEVRWFDADVVMSAVEAGDPDFCLCPDGLRMVIGAYRQG